MSEITDSDEEYEDFIAITRSLEDQAVKAVQDKGIVGSPRDIFEAFEDEVSVIGHYAGYPYPRMADEATDDEIYAMASSLGLI